MKKLSIVILNYNGKDLLKNCIESIFQSLRLKAKGRKLETEIVVVDNNSTDGSKKFLEKLTRSNGSILDIIPMSHRDDIKNKKISAKQISNEYRELISNIQVIFNDRNFGFAGGNNVGIKHALDNGADYIMLLNNDVIVKNEFWQPMVEYMEDNQSVGIMGPKIYFAPGYEFHYQRYSENERGKVIWYAGGKIDWDNVYLTHRGVDKVDKGQYDEIEETDFVSGCCMMARRKVWEKVGLLDERYFLYYEDSDFCQRAKKQEWKTIYFPKAKIWHMNAGSSRVGSELQDYYNSRNRMLFGLRWAPIRAKFALFRESIKLLFNGRKWQKIGIRDFYLRRFGKGSWK